MSRLVIIVAAAAMVAVGCVSAFWEVLSTDLATDILTWLSFIIALVGFPATIYSLYLGIEQIKKTRGAAEAAVEAIAHFSGLVTGREQLMEVNQAVSYAEKARDELARGAVDSFNILADMAVKSIIHAKELDRSKLNMGRYSRSMLLINKVKDDVAGRVDNLSISIYSDVSYLNEAIGSLTEISAKLRYTYDKEAAR